METLPEYIKDCRQRLGYELKHVSKVTNISERFLQALEQGYYHRLPANVYVYGFLRKLAELYQTDCDLLVAQYKKERGIHKNMSARKDRYAKQRGTDNSVNENVPYKITEHPKSYNPSRLAITPRTLVLWLLSGFMIFVLGYLAYQVRAINKPPGITIFEPADNSVVSSSSVLVHGQTDIASNMTINDQPVFVDSSGNFNQLISISPGTKTLVFLAKNNFGKQNSKQISITADFQNSGSRDQNASDQSSNSGLSLAISVKNIPTTVSVKIDDDPAPQTNNLLPGQTTTYTAKNRILLSTENAGNTLVSLNGKNLGPMGRTGETLRDVKFSNGSAASAANN